MKKTLFLMLLISGAVIISGCSQELVNKLSDVESRANDLTRNADISMVSTALKAYKIENGIYPSLIGGLDQIKDELISVGLEDIPQDPTDSSFDGLVNVKSNKGQYLYIPLNKSGDVYEGFVIIAKTETVSGSNRVFDKNNPIEKFTKTDSIKVCDNLILSSYIKNANDGSCYYTSSGDLGHIYVDRPN